MRHSHDFDPVFLQTVKYASKQRNKLYICNIPKNKTRQQLLTAFRALTPGVVDLDVTMQKDQGKPSENRGFCFLDMYNQAAAEQAMATLASPTLQFEGEYGPFLVYCPFYTLRTRLSLDTPGS